jgi:hypothetical protein
VKQIRKRLTYANVMSSIAVFLVLGGATAVAATKIGANELKANTVKTGKIVKEAVTAGKIKNSAISNTKLANAAVTSTKLADNAVTTTKIADKAVTGAKINTAGLGTVPNATHATNATSATNATNAANLTGLYFAVVNANATLARGSAGVSVEASGGNAYRVFLPGAVNTKNCFFVGSLGGNSPGNPEDGEISVNPSGTANAIYVTTFNSAGAGAAKEFSVLVRC